MEIKNTPAYKMSKKKKQALLILADSWLSGKEPVALDWSPKAPKGAAKRFEVNSVWTCSEGYLGYNTYRLAWIDRDSETILLNMTKMPLLYTHYYITQVDKGNAKRQEEDRLLSYYEMSEKMGKPVKTMYRGTEYDALDQNSWHIRQEIRCYSNEKSFKIIPVPFLPELGEPQNYHMKDYHRHFYKQILNEWAWTMRSQTLPNVKERIRVYFDNLEIIIKELSEFVNQKFANPELDIQFNELLALLKTVQGIPEITRTSEKDRLDRE